LPISFIDFNFKLVFVLFLNLTINEFQVCAKEDVDRARKIALDAIVMSVAARNNKTSSVAPGN
jgi:hypothetical protein